MKEAGVLEKYLQTHKIDLSNKYSGYAVATESMYFDVSLQKNSPPTIVINGQGCTSVTAHMQQQ